MILPLYVKRAMSNMKSKIEGENVEEKAILKFRCCGDLKFYDKESLLLLNNYNRKSGLNYVVKTFSFIHL